MDTPTNTTKPLAAAAVQEHLKRSIGLHGGGLRSVQSLPSLAEDDLTPIGHGGTKNKYSM